MKTVRLKPEHSAYLSRVARKLSDMSGKRVSGKEVLHVLIEIAIRDEGMYDPKSTAPLNEYSRVFRQAEKEARTASFDVVALFDTLRAI